MISLSVSQAFAYDMLAIASIKMSMNPGNRAAEDSLVRLAREIEGKVGARRHMEVMESPEYLRLYKVNREMYIRIDELKLRGERPGDAVFIDSRVYQRFLAKRALQERWFPEDDLGEQKMGYGEGKGR